MSLKVGIRKQVDWLQAVCKGYTGLLWQLRAMEDKQKSNKMFKPRQFYILGSQEGEVHDGCVLTAT